MKLLSILLTLCICFPGLSQEAQIEVIDQKYRTYDYSDPDPVVSMNKIYPYYTYDGYDREPHDKSWKVIEMENEFIKVLIAPEIGGKILGAIEKSTGNEFLYYNKVVKFRKIAMRGPWTSGGLEFNFGTIGHTPMVATPVDYFIRKNEDGSVSCFISAADLQPRTKWTVEMRLPKDKALIEIYSSWHNGSNLETSLYHWTNAAAEASDDLRYYYPGNKHIDHGGKDFDYPINPDGVDLSLYGNNKYGGNKSLHILGKYTDFFGGYWENKDYGFAHWADYADKPGKKLWMWSTARDGAIWEDLLTDPDLGNKQYMEYQSGVLYNQSGDNSTETPFKHLGFGANGTMSFKEIFMPVKGIGGISIADENGSLHINNQDNGKSILKLCPVVPMNGKIEVLVDGGVVISESLNLNPLEIYSREIDNGDIEVSIDGKLLYSTKNEEQKILSRPTASAEFNWETAFGHYLKAAEKGEQRLYSEAKKAYERSLEIDNTFIPSLEGLAETYYRMMDYQTSEEYALKALSFDTYSPKANYFHALNALQENDLYNALDGFSIASKDMTFRALSFRELSKIHIGLQNYKKGLDFAERSLQFDGLSESSQLLKLIALRLLGEIDKAKDLCIDLLVSNPLNHSARTELIFLNDSKDWNSLKEIISNEFSDETYLEIALLYYSINRFDEAFRILENSKKSAINLLWMSHLKDLTNDSANSQQYLNEGLALSPELVLPFRPETYNLLTKLVEKNDHWKLHYYKGLIAWAKMRTDEAQTLFQSVGSKADFAPFYLTRINLMKGEANFDIEKDFNKAFELDSKSWRIAAAKTDYYLDMNNPKKAVEISRAGLKNTVNTEMEYNYAKSLVANNEYAAALKVLKKAVILPSEGARAGRVLYFNATIMEAISQLKKGKYKDALEYINDARLWPENLGVGKPYDVDETIEDYLEALCFSKMNKKKEAAAKWSEISKNDKRYRESPAYIAWLLSVKKSDESKFQRALDKAKEKSENSDFYKKLVENLEGNTEFLIEDNSKLLSNDYFNYALIKGLLSLK